MATPALALRNPLAQSPPSESSRPKQPKQAARAAQKRANEKRYQHPLVVLLRRYAQQFGDFEAPLLEAAKKINFLASVDEQTMVNKIVAAIDRGCNALV